MKISFLICKVGAVSFPHHLEMRWCLGSTQPIKDLIPIRCSADLSVLLLSREQNGDQGLELAGKQTTAGEVWERGPGGNIMGISWVKW